jgi:Mor family transcriptional regulator
VRYQKAEDVLPAQLLAEIQKYADGVYLYIPRRPDHRKSWGNSTRYREELQMRNVSIRFLHREGLSAEELAERFHLSVKSIQRVLRQK